MKLIKKNVLSRFRKKFLLNALFLNFDIYLFFLKQTFTGKSRSLLVLYEMKNVIPNTTLRETQLYIETVHNRDKRLS